MKHLKKTATVIALFVVATSFVNAQTKLAHINVQQLLSEMPEMIEANKELKKLQETFTADIESSITELKNKYTQYSNESASKTEEENKKRSLELQGFEKNIGEAQQAAQKEIQKKQIELYGPITEKAKLAIEKVAATLGFDYVMDASQGGGLIVSKGKDMLVDVKKELGL